MGVFQQFILLVMVRSQRPGFLLVEYSRCVSVSALQRLVHERSFIECDLRSDPPLIFRPDSVCGDVIFSVAWGFFVEDQKYQVKSVVHILISTF